MGSHEGCPYRGWWSAAQAVERALRCGRAGNRIPLTTQCGHRGQMPEVEGKALRRTRLAGLGASPSVAARQLPLKRPARKSPCSDLPCRWRCQEVTVGSVRYLVRARPEPPSACGISPRGAGGEGKWGLRAGLLKGIWWIGLLEGGGGGLAAELAGGGGSLPFSRCATAPPRGEQLDRLRALRGVTGASDGSDRQLRRAGAVGGGDCLRAACGASVGSDCSGAVGGGGCQGVKDGGCPLRNGAGPLLPSASPPASRRERGSRPVQRIPSVPSR